MEVHSSVMIVKIIIKNNNMKKIEKVLSKLPINSVVFGCDPEFFFEKKGKIIGSEKIIDIKEGLKMEGERKPAIGYNGSIQTGVSKFIVDGVQIELNPKPDTCRARLGNEISQCFRMLYSEMEKHKGLKANFEPTVKMTKKELMSLDKKSRVFGCSPSKNADNKKENKIKVDPTKYKYRSAGGHIHIGKDGEYSSIKHVFNEPDRLVQILDIIVGNTCVIIDRNEGNKERRKVYGKAGEYRTPSYGIEYRTLSNFWLKSYPLMSFVMSLSRLSVNILAHSKPGCDYEAELLSLVKIEDVRKAINKNDLKLAIKNFKKIKKFLENISSNSENFPLTTKRIEAFEFFAKKGIDYWFKEDPMEHWIKLPEGHNCGWETFLDTKVMPEMTTK